MYKTSWKNAGRRSSAISAMESLDSIEFNLTGGGAAGGYALDGFTRLISGITDARVSYPNGDGKTARDAWRKNSLHSSDKVSGHTTRRNERERTSSERVRRAGPAVGASLSHCQSHQTTVIATGATSHRVLDAGANTIVRFSPSLSPLTSPSLSFSSSSFPIPFLCRSYVLLSHSVLFPPKPGPPMSPSQDFVLRRIAELLAAANVTGSN